MPTNKTVDLVKNHIKSKSILEKIGDKKAGTMLSPQDLDSLTPSELTEYEKYIEWVRKPKGRGYPI